MKKQICVIGSSSATSEQIDLGYQVGKIIAKNGFTTITGGRTGVMAAVARGVDDEGGISVGILPGADLGDANEFNTINIPTGMGYTRNSVNILAADLVIAVGGASGTLNEITFAWMYKKPVCAIKGSGGWSEEMANDSFTNHPERELPVVSVEELDMMLKTL